MVGATCITKMEELFLYDGEGLVLHVDAVVLDGTGSALLHTGQILQSGELLLAAEVDDEVVGELSTLCGCPISALLEVVDTVASAVAAALVLAVGILDGPGLAAQTVALSIE